MFNSDGFSSGGGRDPGSVAHPARLTKPTSRAPNCGRMGSPLFLAERLFHGPVDLTERHTLRPGNPHTILILRGKYRKTVASPTALSADRAPGGGNLPLLPP